MPWRLAACRFRLKRPWSQRAQLGEVRNLVRMAQSNDGYQIWKRRQ